MKKITLSLALCVLIVSAFSIYSVAQEGQDISDNFVRLHIRADSNDENAQKIKLQVRDYVLKKTKGLFVNVNSVDDAKKVISENLGVFEQTANEALKQAGVDYKAHAVFGKNFFPTREYNNFTLPAGKYDSLIINLGSGKGKNWWCVIYPTLCYSGSDVSIKDKDKVQGSLSDEEYGLITGSDGEKTVVKFKILEWFTDIKEYFSDQDK
ncbi:MAG: stage II sporulation protein R [Bacillota bacterium]|nr:stage II sporulation protein R [Bacillota bacterium]